ncbi:MAG: flagellar filament capping protein FliD [Planctomycetes bacterium]|nr:flagellar filament capping protein FliD [Planctomycetota bacterium]
MATVNSISSFSSSSSGSAGINFSGIASGIDTQAIIDALTKLEARPIDAAQQKQDLLTKLQGQIGQLSTKLTALQTAAGKLTTIASGTALSATSSDTTILTASAAAPATVGPHSIEVTQLAQASSAYLSAVAKITDPAAALGGTGNINISYSGGTAVPIDVANRSLNDIAQAINDNVAGVNASVVNAGTSANADYRLVVTGEDTGASHGLTFTIDSTVGLGSTTVSGAQNAKFNVDGITGIQRESNTVSDYLNGVTFTLTSTTQANKPVTLTISTDVTGVKNKIKDLVNAYNDIVNYYNSNNTYNSATKVAGTFFGDNSTGSIITNLRSMLFHGGSNYVQQNSGTYGSLSALGISFQSDGTLQVDDSKLTTAVGENTTSVLDLFADSDGGGSDTGIAIEIRKFAQFATTGGKDDATGASVVGLLSAKTDSIKTQIASLQKTIDNGQAHLDSYTQQLKEKYAKFEEVMGQLKQQQATLAAKFG